MKVVYWITENQNECQDTELGQTRVEFRKFATQDETLKSIIPISLKQVYLTDKDFMYHIRVEDDCFIRNDFRSKIVRNVLYYSKKYFSNYFYFTEDIKFYRFDFSNLPQDISHNIIYFLDLNSFQILVDCFLLNKGLITKDKCISDISESQVEPETRYYQKLLHKEKMNYVFSELLYRTNINATVLDLFVERRKREPEDYIKKYLLTIPRIGYQGTIIDFVTNCILFVDTLLEARSPKNVIKAVLIFIKGLTKKDYYDIFSMFISPIKHIFKLCFEFWSDDFDIKNFSEINATADTTDDKSVQFLDNMHRVRVTRDNLVKSDFTQRLMSFCGMVISLPLFAGYDIDLTCMGFSQAFAKRVQKRNQYDHVLQIMDGIMMDVHYFVEKIAICVESRDIGYLLYDDDERRKYDKMFNFISHYYNRLNTIDSAIFEYKDEFGKNVTVECNLVWYYDQCDLLIKLNDKMCMAHEDEAKRKEWKTQRAFLERCKYTVGDKLRVMSERDQPFAWCICGSPGIGKTNLNHRLLEMCFENEIYLFKRRSERYNSEMMWVYPQTDEFMPEFRTSHKVCHLDDVGQFQSEYNKQMKGGLITKVLDLVNSVPYSTKQASLADKGNIPFRADYVTMTSNIIDAGINEVFNEKSGALRRFIFIDSEVKPEYRKDGSSLLGGSGDPEDQDMWLTSFRRYINIEGAYNLQYLSYKDGNMRWHGNPHNRTKHSLYECQKILAKLQYDHYYQANTAKESLEIFRSADWCVRCEANSTICLCKQRQNDYDRDFPPLETNATMKIFGFDTEDPMLKAYVKCHGYTGAAKVLAFNTYYQVSNWAKPKRSNWYDEYTKNKETWCMAAGVAGLLAVMGMIRQFSKTMKSISDPPRYNVREAEEIWHAGHHTRSNDYVPPRFWTQTPDNGGYVSHEGWKMYLDQIAEAHRKFSDKEFEEFLCTEKLKVNATGQTTSNPWVFEKQHVTDIRNVPHGVDIPKMRNILSRNVCYVFYHYYTDDGEKRRCGMNMTGLHGCVGVLPRHFFVNAKDHDMNIIELFVVRGNIDTKATISTKITVDVSVLQNGPGDTVFIRHEKLGPFKDIRPYFSDKIIEGKMECHVIIRTEEGHLRQVIVDACEKIDHVKYNVHHNRPDLEKMEAFGYSGYFKGDMSSGVCGSLYFSQLPNGRVVILGHQVATGPDKSYCQRVLKDDIPDCDLNSLPIDHLDFQKHYQTDLDLSYRFDLHPKDPLRDFEGTLDVIGTLNLPVAKLKSQVRSTIMCDDVMKRYNLKVPTHFSPKDVSAKRCILNNYKNVTDKVDIPPGLIKKAEDGIFEWYVRVIEDNKIEMPTEPFSMDVGINGLDGVDYVDRLVGHTSGGFAHRGRKDKNFIVIPSDDIHQVKYDVTDEIKLEIDALFACYDRGEKAPIVADYCFKDEPIKQKKIDNDDARLFNSMPLHFNIAFRMYFLPFVPIFTGPFRHLFGHAVGANPFGRDWAVLYEWITKHGLDRCIAGDYKKFDKKMTADVLAAAFRIIRRLAEKYGWHDSHIKRMKGLITDLVYCIINVFNTLVMLSGNNPSGQPFTTIINGIVNLLYLMICFIVLAERNNCTDYDLSHFTDYVSVLVYGDDNCMGVNKNYKWFNHSSISEVMAGFGLTYTMADKEAESVPYIHVNNIDFLKRKFVVRNNHVFCPLAEESIIKSLHVCTQSKVVTLKQQCAEIILSANMEFFQYGRGRFEHEHVFFQKLLDKYGLRNYINSGHLPTYQEYCEKFGVAIEATHIITKLDYEDSASDNKYELPDRDEWEQRYYERDVKYIEHLLEVSLMGPLHSYVRRLSHTDGYTPLVQLAFSSVYQVTRIMCKNCPEAFLDVSGSDQVIEAAMEAQKLAIRDLQDEMDLVLSIRDYVIEDDDATEPEEEINATMAEYIKVDGKWVKKTYVPIICTATKKELWDYRPTLHELFDYFLNKLFLIVMVFWIVLYVELFCPRWTIPHFYSCIGWYWSTKKVYKLYRVCKPYIGTVKSLIKYNCKRLLSKYEFLNMLNIKNFRLSGIFTCPRCGTPCFSSCCGSTTTTAFAEPLPLPTVVEEKKRKRVKRRQTSDSVNATMADKGANTDSGDNVTSTSTIETSAPGSMTTASNQETVFGFSDGQDAVELSYRPGVSMMNHLNTATPQADLAHFLSRPIVFHRITWDPAVVPTAFRINPWVRFLSATNVLDKLRLYKLFSGTLKIRITVNGTPFHYGRYFVGVNPSQDTNNTTDLDPDTNVSIINYDRSGVNDSWPANRVFYSQRPHVFVNPTTNSTSVITWPFFHVAPFTGLFDSVSNGSTMGDLEIWELNRLRMANGNTDPVTISFFAWMEDVQLVGINATMSDEYVGNGIVSRPATALARFAARFAGTSQIGKLARATEIGANAVGSIASLFGFSAPAIIDKQTVIAKLQAGRMANTTGHSPVVKLSLDPKQELSIDPTLLHLPARDEMSFDYISKIEALVYQYQLQTSQVGHFFGMAIHPTIGPLVSAASTGGVMATNGKALTPMGLVATPFKNWRGSIVVRFQFVCSQMHRGRILVTYTPTSDSTVGDPSSLPELNEFYGHVIDLAEANDVSFEVKWNQALMFHEIDHYSATDTEIDIVEGTATTITRTNTFTNGRIDLHVLNRVAAPDNSAFIYFNVWVRAGDDFQVANPDEEYMKYTYSEGGGLFPLTDATMSDINATMAVDSAYMCCDEGDACGQSNAIVLNECFGETPADVMFSTYFGEQILSIRSLMKRFAPYNSYFASSAATSRYFEVTIQQPNFPIGRAGGTYGSSGVDQQGTISNVWMTHIRWFGQAYVGYRGGIRYGVGIFCPNGQVLMRAKRSAFVNGINIAEISNGGATASSDAQIEDYMQGDGGSGSYFGSDYGGAAGLQVFTNADSGFMTYEIPYYSGGRYVEIQESANSYAYGEMRRSHMIAFDVPTPYAAPAGTQPSIGIRTYVAAGEDFQFIFFVGVPFIYLQTPR